MTEIKLLTCTVFRFFLLISFFIYFFEATHFQLFFNINVSLQMMFIFISFDLDVVLIINYRYTLDSRGVVRGKVG